MREPLAASAMSQELRFHGDVSKSATLKFDEFWGIFWDIIWYDGYDTTNININQFGVSISNMAGKSAEDAAINHMLAITNQDMNVNPGAIDPD